MMCRCWFTFTENVFIALFGHCIHFEAPSKNKEPWGEWCPQKCQLKSKRNEKWTGSEKKEYRPWMNILRNVMWLCWFVYRCTNITHAEKKSRASNFSHICVESEMERGFTTALHTSIDGHGEKKNPRQINNSSSTHHLSLVGRQQKNRRYFFFSSRKAKIIFSWFRFNQIGDWSRDGLYKKLFILLLKPFCNMRIIIFHFTKSWNLNMDFLVCKMKRNCE